jgi:hypothetical protein
VRFGQPAAERLDTALDLQGHSNRCHDGQYARAARQGPPCATPIFWRWYRNVYAPGGKGRRVSFDPASHRCRESSTPSDRGLAFRSGLRPALRGPSTTTARPQPAPSRPTSSPWPTRNRAAILRDAPARSQADSADRGPRHRPRVPIVLESGVDERLAPRPLADAPHSAETSADAHRGRAQRISWIISPPKSSTRSTCGGT